MNPQKQILIKAKEPGVTVLSLDTGWGWEAALVIHSGQQKRKTWRPNSEFVQVPWLLWIMLSFWWEHEVEQEAGQGISMETLLSICPRGNLPDLIAKTYYAWSIPTPCIIANTLWMATDFLLDNTWRGWRYLLLSMISVWQSTSFPQEAGVIMRVMNWAAGTI